jgi:DNA-binding beta-propeller fold protein YncE
VQQTSAVKSETSNGSNTKRIEMMSYKLKSLALLGSLFSCVLTGHVGAAELKMISKVQVPGAPLDSFDISYVDQKKNRYYLADRSNKAVDIVDGATEKVVGQVPGFVGFDKDNDTAGPNGVLVIGNEAWAGDGDSSVKVIDLKSQTIVDTIKTGGKNRADEMAYDPKHHVFIVTNDADDPPFVTLISTKPGHKILKKIVFNDATDGIEQPIYYAPKSIFLMTVPEIKGDKSTGGIAMIDPLKGEVTNVMKVSDCTPAGLARGPGKNLVIGCNAGGKKSTLKPVTLIVNGDSGAVVASVPDMGAADEVAYSAKNGQYYISGRQMPDGPVLGVIDAKTNTLLQSIPTGGNAHSVATSDVNGHVFVPLPKTGGPCGGCIGVYSIQ